MAAAGAPLQLMGLANRRHLLLLLLLIPLHLPDVVLAQTRTMCVAQLALANQACAILPVIQANTSSGGGVTSTPLQDENYDVLGHDHGDGHGHRHGHGHGRRHHGRRRRHAHGYGRVEPFAHKNCCRWLEALDKACVCDTLLRLPLSFVKPKHAYSISVGRSCKVTFKCGGV